MTTNTEEVASEELLRGGEESVSMARERVASFMRKIVGSLEGTVLIVSHSYIIRLIKELLAGDNYAEIKSPTQGSYSLFIREQQLWKEKYYSSNHQKI